MTAHLSGAYTRDTPCDAAYDTRVSAFVAAHQTTGDGSFAHLAPVPDVNYRVFSAPDPARQPWPVLTKDREPTRGQGDDRLIGGVGPGVYTAFEARPTNTVQNLHHCAPVAGIEYDYFEGLPLNRLQQNQWLHPERMPFPENSTLEYYYEQNRSC